MTETTFLIMGQIVRPHGVRGEMRVQLRTDFPDSLLDAETLYLGHDPESPEDLTPVILESARFHKDNLLIRLVDVQDRNDVELLRGQYLMLPEDALEPLEPGEFFYFQLLNMEVYTDSGDFLGTIKHIIETGANDVFVVEGGQWGEVLIPDTDEVVQQIDGDTGRITIAPIPGLLPDLPDNAD